MGGGLVIPHARCAQVKEVHIAVATSNHSCFSTSIKHLPLFIKYRSDFIEKDVLLISAATGEGLNKLTNRSNSRNAACAA